MEESDGRGSESDESLVERRMIADHSEQGGRRMIADRAAQGKRRVIGAKPLEQTVRCMSPDSTTDLPIRYWAPHSIRENYFLAESLHVYSKLNKLYLTFPVGQCLGQSRQLQ